MPQNDFLPFAGASGANVISQTDYAALTALSMGFQAGVAKSAQINKVFRQSSIMAAVLGAFIAENSGANVIDDGTTATIRSSLDDAIKMIAWGNTSARLATQAEAEAGTDNVKQMSPLRVAQAIAAQFALISAATESTAGIAKVATQAQTNAGADDASIVTPKKLLSGVSMNLGPSGYLVLPAWLGGLIVQWGTVTSSGSSDSVTFPIAFPSTCLSVSPGSMEEATGNYYFGQVTAKSTTGFTLAKYGAAPGAAPAASSTSITATWIAIGN